MITKAHTSDHFGPLAVQADEKPLLRDPSGCRFINVNQFQGLHFPYAARTFKALDCCRDHVVRSLQPLMEIRDSH